MESQNKLNDLVRALRDGPTAAKVVQGGCALVVAVAALSCLSSRAGAAAQGGVLPPMSADRSSASSTEGGFGGQGPQRVTPGVRPGETPARGRQARPDEDDDEPEEITDGGSAPPAGGESLAQALGRFRRSTDPNELEELAAALGASEDPAVAKAALEVAASDPSPLRRAAAFDLLDALDAPGALPIALRALDRERDPWIRRAALFALPGQERGGNAAEVGNVLAAILSRDPDVEARRRAALVLGEWPSAPSASAILAEGLRRDPSPEVRAGCAFALESAGCASPVARAALVAALENKSEDPVVRDNAWHALETVDALDLRERTARTAWAETRVALFGETE